MALISDVRTVPADERGAYLLAGALRAVAWVCSTMSVGVALFLAFASTEVDATERALVFGAVGGVGLLIAALFLFLSYVLALLAGLHAMSRAGVDEERPVRS
jgi:hypothetical protein